MPPALAARELNGKTVSNTAHHQPDSPQSFQQIGCGDMNTHYSSAEGNYHATTRNVASCMGRRRSAARTFHIAVLHLDTCDTTSHLFAAL
jgi:hypothetical protein